MSEIQYCERGCDLYSCCCYCYCIAKESIDQNGAFLTVLPDFTAPRTTLVKQLLGLRREATITAFVFFHNIRQTSLVMTSSGGLHPQKEMPANNTKLVLKKNRQPEISSWQNATQPKRKQYIFWVVFFNSKHLVSYGCVYRHPYLGIDTGY